VRLTLTKHPDAQVDTLVVYARDVTAGEDVRRRVGTVANPAGATTTYAVTSNSWGSGTEAPTDHDVPAVMTFAVVWKNRMWGVDATVGNRLRFTQIFEDQSWPADFTIDIPFEKGDDIAALLPLGDTLLVFGQSKIFLVIGQTSLDFEVRPSGASQAGALGARVCRCAGGRRHPRGGGRDLLVRRRHRSVAVVRRGWLRAHGDRAGVKYVTAASASELAATPLVYHQASKEVAIGVTHLYPFGTAGEWILDLNRTRLQEVPSVDDDRAAPSAATSRGTATSRPPGTAGRLWSWNQTTGQLAEERTGTTANGSDLVAQYTAARRSPSGASSAGSWRGPWSSSRTPAPSGWNSSWTT
jgi:hypothetical protein